MNILEIFSTRELAVGLYLLLLIVFSFSKKPIRESIYALLKKIFLPKIILVFLSLIIYTLLALYLLSSLDLWRIAYLKDTVMWFCMVGVPVFFSVLKKAEENYYKNMITSNLKFSVLLELFINSYSFSLLAEISWIGILTFLIICKAVADNDEELKSIGNLLKKIITALIFLLLMIEAVMFIVSYKTLDFEFIYTGFILPIIFSIVYIPITYFLELYSVYEDLFVRIKFKSKASKEVLLRRKIGIMLICGPIVKNVVRFKEIYIKKRYIEDGKNFFDVIKEYFTEKHLLGF